MSDTKNYILRSDTRNIAQVYLLQFCAIEPPYLIAEDISSCLHCHDMCEFCKNFVEYWTVKLTCNRNRLEEQSIEMTSQSTQKQPKYRTNPLRYILCILSGNSQYTLLPFNP